MVQQFLNGGPFMWPILIAALIGLIFVLERFAHMIGGMSTGEPFANDVSETVMSEGIDAAITKCEDAKGPVANILLSALERAHRSVEEAEDALDNAGAIEMASMEKNMSWISLMITTAPMLGFLGTVVGMIKAFNDIKAAQDISPAVVADGISIALLTTAFGLIVGIFLQILQNGVMYMIDNRIVVIQRSIASLTIALREKFLAEK